MHTYIYMHITAVKKKDLNFKGNKEDILEDLGGEKGMKKICNYI